jgi:deoxyribose-phosphate aldolase
MELNRYFDHTLLKQDATSDAIVKLCTEAKQYDFMSVCVNPDFVALAAKELKGSNVKVCTVIGFPLGANVPEIKALEARRAILDGATEVDMVLNVSKVKDGDYAYVENEIRLIKEAVGDILLKVILETCLLTDEEVVESCKAAERAGADYVNTSTGFSKGGATPHHVALMRKTVGDRLGVKASGGVHNKAEALAMIEAGASRIGASASVAIMEEK